MSDLEVNDHSTDGMICWYPPEEIQHRLAIQSGELPEDIHMTLAYFPDIQNIDPEELVGEITQWAQYTDILQGELSGVGRFSGPDKDVAYVSLDVPFLSDMRSNLMSEVLNGYYPAVNHGFTPHMTIKYLSENEPNPLDRLEPINIVINSISVVLGGNRVDILLSDGEVMEKAWNATPAPNIGDMWEPKMVHGQEKKIIGTEPIDTMLQGKHNSVMVNRHLESEGDAVEELLEKNMDDPTHVVESNPVTDAAIESEPENRQFKDKEYDQRGSIRNI